jgi:hypothetical protein
MQLSVLRRLVDPHFGIVNTEATEFLRTQGYAADGERLLHS